MMSIFPKAQSKTSSRARRLNSGFTLVEALVVISIIVVLAVTLTAVVGRVRREASSAVCVSKMSQFGSTLQLYAQENSGRLPTSRTYGTLHTGQGPWYNRDDRRFQSVIGEYLGCAESTTWSTQGASMTFDASLAWPALLAQGQPGASSVLLNTSVQLLTNGTVGTGSPWAGSPTAPGGPYVGRMLHQIDEPRNQRVFVEVDQKNTNAGWKHLQPPGPIHGNYRNCLYFDWHVDRLVVKP